MPTNTVGKAYRFSWLALRFSITHEQEVITSIFTSM